MSEEQIARALGVTKATVRAWESGRGEPRGRRREAYARLLTPPYASSAPAPPTDEHQTGAPPLTPAGGAGTGPGSPGSPVPGGPAARSAPGSGSPAGPGPDPDRSSNGDGTGSTAPPDVRPPIGPGGTAPAPGAAREGDPEPSPVPAGGKAAAGTAGAPGPGLPGGTPAGPPAGGTTDRPAPGGKAAAGSTGTAGSEPTAAGVAPGSAGHRGAGPAGGTGPTPAGAAALGAALAAARTPAEAFDALYTHCAPGLVRQAYLLTGRLRLAHEAVERAFHIAWQQWPDVARDRDPVGWVRSASYELALSPWHRLRPAHRHADSPPLDRAGRELLAVLLRLPPPYRRTVLLYDGLGLDLPETAAETEASTPAAANRLLHARETLAAELPELADPGVLRDRLAVLLADGGPVPQPVPAYEVRTTGERRAWFWTRMALTATVMVMSATGLTLATAPTRYVPEVAPGQRVGGVPGHAGPQRLTPRDMALREMLRTTPAAGPARLLPEPR